MLSITYNCLLKPNNKLPALVLFLCFDRKKDPIGGKNLHPEPGVHRLFNAAGTMSVKKVGGG